MRGDDVKIWSVVEMTGVCFYCGWFVWGDERTEGLNGATTKVKSRR